MRSIGDGGCTEDGSNGEMEAWWDAEVDMFLRKGIFERSLDGCDDDDDGEVAGDEYDEDDEADENNEDESLFEALKVES